eukprot:EC794605.1.p2 GENE.EC794605.1~~EC794605.1.p2  ORF type:complete len:153 (-),score=9.72 EC794605.1:43-501(-)
MDIRCWQVEHDISKFTKVNFNRRMGSTAITDRRDSATTQVGALGCLTQVLTTQVMNLVGTDDKVWLTEIHAHWALIILRTPPTILRHILHTKPTPSCFWCRGSPHCLDHTKHEAFFVRSIADHNHFIAKDDVWIAVLCDSSSCSRHVTGKTG